MLTARRADADGINRRVGEQLVIRPGRNAKTLGNLPEAASIVVPDPHQARALLRAGLDRLQVVLRYHPRDENGKIKN